MILSSGFALNGMVSLGIISGPIQETQGGIIRLLCSGRKKLITGFSRRLELHMLKCGLIAMKN